MKKAKLQMGKLLEIGIWVILFSVLLKVAVTVGIDPIQFSIAVVLNLTIGLTTLPVGACLFITSRIGRISLSNVSKAILPFLAVSIFVLLPVTYIPNVPVISLFFLICLFYRPINIYYCHGLFRILL